MFETVQRTLFYAQHKSEGKEEEGEEVEEGEGGGGDAKAEGKEAEGKEAEGKEEEGKDSTEAKYLESESAFFGVMRHSVRVDEVRFAALRDLCSLL